MKFKNLFFCILLLFSFFYVNSFQFILDNVKHALNSANEFVENVAFGLKTLKVGVEIVDQVVQSAGDGKCNFFCKTGEKLVPNRKFKAVPGGCGAYGVTLSCDNCPAKDFSNCCDDHDICYGTCLADKEFCDEKFLKCLEKSCNKGAKRLGEKKYTDCKIGAKIFYAGTRALGCKAYVDAQSEACWCIHEEL